MEGESFEYIIEEHNEPTQTGAGIISSSDGESQDLAISSPQIVSDDGSYLNGPVAVEGQVVNGMRGFIKVYNSETGWGFIKCSGQTKSKDVFLHRNQFTGARPALNVSEAQSSIEEQKHYVLFDMDWIDPSKPKAVNVRLESTKAGNMSIYQPEIELGQSRVCLNCGTTLVWLHTRCSVCGFWYGMKGQKGEKGGFQTSKGLSFGGGKGYIQKTGTPAHGPAIAAAAG